MTRAVFYYDSGLVSGFSVSGHTDSSGSEQAKIVCSAVSSAVYMAANTVTDVIGDTAEITLRDGLFTLRLANPSERSNDVLRGLLLHLQALEEQYSKYIVINTEVQHDA